MSRRDLGSVSSPGPFDQGTSVAFFQAAAPVGYTQDTSNTDAMLRVVSGSGGGTGGSDSATTGLTITDAHQLTIAQMPAHTHDVEKISTSGGGLTRLTHNTTVTDVTSQADAALTKGGDGTHTHAITFAPKFLDLIIATQN